MTQPLLELKNLTTLFPTRRGEVPAVKELNLKIAQGEILGIVGESGCGKSTVLLSILRLISRPGYIAAGQICFTDRDLLTLPPSAMRAIRGKEISMIFQDPLTTLNPIFPVGEQIREVIKLHGIMKGVAPTLAWPFNGARRALEKKRTLEVMQEVGIPAPEARYRAYPHQFSGGMQQRALIAIALVCQPKLILADEPTTALDVTIQAQIMDLMGKINREHGTSIILVTHNLGLAAEFCHTISVMYAGRIVERGPVNEVIQNPKHPYTSGLLACSPRMTRSAQRLEPIPGNVPDLAELTSGCAFAPRCPFAQPGCMQQAFRLRKVGHDHFARCILYEGGERYTPDDASRG